MQYGRPDRQRGATFLGMVIIGGILLFALFAGIRLWPLFYEYMAVSRALTQTQDALKGGDNSQVAIIRSLERRWEIEDIKSCDYQKNIKISKVNDGVEVTAKYRAETSFIANVSFVVDFEKSVVIPNNNAGL